MTPRQALSTFALFFALGTTAFTAEVPKVFLSDQHKAMCKVGVGDPIPVQGKAGERATVVAFVKNNGWMTRQLLKDLPLDVEKPYAANGVALQVVRVGKAAPPTGKLPATADADGKLFAQLGEGAASRVYVLDAKGKIAWFDLEYSRSTRRELRQTLEALTGRE